MLKLEHLAWDLPDREGLIKDLDLTVEDGKLVIDQEGEDKKFKNTLQQITFSGTVAAQNNKNILFVTERAVLKLTRDGLVVTEIAPGLDLERDVLGQMEFRPSVAPDLKQMDQRIFLDCPMGLQF